MTFPDSEAPLMPGTARLRELRVYRKWQGVLVPCSLSMTTDKMLIDKINQSRRGTPRGTIVPTPHTIFRRKKFWKRKFGSSILPMMWREAAFLDLLIESLTDRLVMEIQPWLWRGTQP